MTRTEEFRLCTCGVEAPHGRNFIDNIPGKVHFSHEGLLRKFAIMNIPQIVQETGVELSAGIPKDPHDAYSAFLDIARRHPQGSMQEKFAALRVRLLEQAETLPITDEQAWMALPLREQHAITQFAARGEVLFDPSWRPGGHLTPYKERCAYGTNPPNNPQAPCNVVTRLFNRLPLDLQTRTLPPLCQ